MNARTHEDDADYRNASPEPASASPAVRCIERDRFARLIDSIDFSDELFEAREEILAAVRTGSDALTGQVVRAVFEALAERQADKYLSNEGFEVPGGAVYAQDAARAVLDSVRPHPMANTLAERNGAHNSRRFDSRPVTNFGPLIERLA